MGWRLTCDLVRGWRRGGVALDCRAVDVGVRAALDCRSGVLLM